jgi:hypothetical protein
MTTKTCGKCVPIDEHNKQHRQWVLMCWLCTALLALWAATSVLALHWREELMDTRIALDNATDTLAAENLADAKAMKTKPGRTGKWN